MQLRRPNGARIGGTPFFEGPQDHWQGTGKAGWRSLPGISLGCKRTLVRNGRAAPARAGTDRAGQLQLSSLAGARVTEAYALTIRSHVDVSPTQLPSHGNRPAYGSSDVVLNTAWLDVDDGPYRCELRNLR